MLKLARWSTTHRKYVVLGWIVLLVGVNFLAQSAGTDYSNNFTLPKSGTQQASDLLQRSFPAQAGRPRHDRLQGGERLGPRPGSQGEDERDLRRSRQAAARNDRDQPLRGRLRRQGDIRRRQDRVCDGGVRRESQPAPEERRRTGRERRPRCGPARPAGRAGRSGDRVHRAGGLRPVHSRGPARGDRRAAADLRIPDGDGHADRDRAVRSRHGPRRDRPVHACRRHAELLLRARGDDRAGRGHRLLAVHPHALPRGLCHPRARRSATCASRS